MPPVIPALTNVLVGIAGGVEAIGVAGVMVAESIATISTSFAISGVASLLTPKPKSAGSSTSTPVPFSFSMQPADSRRVLYGRGATGGVSNYLNMDGI
jgi:predicted phage tail protein